MQPSSAPDSPSSLSGDASPAFSSISAQRWQEQLHQKFKPRWMGDFEEAVQYGYELGPVVGRYDEMDIHEWISMRNDQNHEIRFVFCGLARSSHSMFSLDEESGEQRSSSFPHALPDQERRIGPFSYKIAPVVNSSVDSA